VFIEAKDDGGGGDNWTTGAISRAKLQSNHHHQQTNIQFFTGRMPFLSPNQQCQSTEGENITFHGLAYLKLTWGSPTLSLTTNSYLLSWQLIDECKADKAERDCVRTWQGWSRDEMYYILTKK